MVYRHGDRSPTKTFPTDPYQENDWPQGFGQLSTTGMRQHHDLGEMLRQRYGNGFLNDSYSRYQIHVRSTDMDRTLMSAESQLSGLYPPSGEQLWNPDIAWQPIPVHTVPYDTDTMLNTGTHCKAYDKLQDEARKSDDFKNLEQQYQETLTVTGRESGLNTSDMVTVWSAVPNTLYCESVSGKTLPDWVSSQIYDDLQYLNAMDFHFKNYNDQMKKLRAGVFLNELLNHTQQKVEGKMDDRMRMFMYSAHDTTVAAILSALGLYPDGCYPPTYASIIMFELGEPTQGNFEMKIYFKNDTIDDPSRQPETPLTLPGCQESCPVNDFVRLVEPMTMTAEEQKNVCDEKEDEGLSAVVMGMFVVLFLLILGLLLLAVAMCLKKRRNSGYQAANFGSAPYG